MGQDQDIGDNSFAIQTQGNVTVNQGMSLAEMGNIMIELNRIVTHFTSEAAAKAEERFQEFKEEVLKKFAQPGQANPNAFADPDFQFVLQAAQQSYARDGNDTTSSLLVELLASRSKLAKRNRLALILNEATYRIGKLTDEDVAILSIAFLLFNVNVEVASFKQWATHFRQFLLPFISDLKPGTSAYAYLESLGCLSRNSAIRRNIYEILFESYKLVFSDPFTMEDLYSKLGDQFNVSAVNSLVEYDWQPEDWIEMAKMDDIDLRWSPGIKSLGWRFNAQNIATLTSKVAAVELDDSHRQIIINFASSRIWEIERCRAHIAENIPELNDLFEVWDRLELQMIHLTSVGLVIGHASVSRVAPQFETPLDVWIN